MKRLLILAAAAGCLMLPVHGWAQPASGGSGCGVASTIKLGCIKPDGVTITVNGAGVAAAVGGSATSITVGTTTIGGGTIGRLLSHGAGNLLAEVATTGSGNVVLATSPTLVTPVLGTVAAGSVLTNATGLPLTTGVTGLLPVANGGTGVGTLTANGIVLAHGTSPFTSLAEVDGSCVVGAAGAWTAGSCGGGGFTGNLTQGGSNLVTFSIGNGAAGGGGTTLLNIFDPGSNANYGSTGLGTEASPIVNADNAAGMKTAVAVMEGAGGRGGSIRLGNGRYNVSATTVLSAPNESITCPEIAWGKSVGGFGFHGNFMATSGCTVIPSASLTSGLIHQASGNVGGAIRNIYSFGLAESDGSMGLHASGGPLVTPWENNVLLGYQYPLRIDTTFAEAMTLQRNITAATSFGAFMNVDTGEMMAFNNNLSDSEYEGWLDLATINVAPRVVTGNSFGRNAGSLTGFHGALSGNTLTVADMISASFTASSSGTTLTVASLSGNMPMAGVLGGNACIPANTYLVEQITGSAHSTGTYRTSQATTCSSTAGVTVASVGYIAPGKIITGSGVAANTIITAQTGGTPGGAGTYTFAGSTQSVSNEFMSAAGSAMHMGGTKNLVISNGIWSPGLNWPYGGSVSADGVLAASQGGIGGMIVDNYIDGASGCGINVTGTNYLISNNFIVNGSGCDINLASTSSNAFVFSILPVTLTDAGTNNIKLYVDRNNRLNFSTPQTTNPLLVNGSPVGGGGGSGTVNSGTAGQLSYYATSAAAVSGNVNANISNGALTLGVANTTIGNIILEGSTSGALTITPQAVAATPTWTAGTSSGTPAVTASSPLAITSATGNITCATCLTSASTITDSVTATWDSTTAVTAQTIDFPIAWTSYTITSVKTKVSGGGSFTAGVKIGGTNVTGCSAISVSGATNTSTTCTAANTGSANNIISIVTSSPSGTVNQAYVSVVFTHTVN